MKLTFQHLHEAIYASLKKDPNTLSLSLPSNHKKLEQVIHQDYTRGQVLTTTAVYCAKLRAMNLGKDDKVIVLAPLSLDTVSLMLAILAIGGVIVLIDVSMKFSHVLASIKSSGAKVMVTTKLFKCFMSLLPATFGIRKITVNSEKMAKATKAFSTSIDWNIVPRQDNDPALITFTSGTTSQPKAVNRTHGILAHQRLAIANNHPAHENALIHCFPVLILYHLSVGTHSVLAHSSSRPIASLAQVTLDQIKRYQADALIAAPTFLDKLTQYAKHHSQQDALAQLRFVGCGGAPIPFKLLTSVNQLCPSASAWVVFGSTEAEPIAHCSFQYAISQGTNRGLPVGSVVSELKYRIVNLPPQLNYTNKDIDAAVCTDYRVGELIISGQHVVEEYLQNERANRNSKIRTQEGVLWHRCGDLAYQDNTGQMFILGRKGDEIHLAEKTIYPFQIEYRIDCLDNIKRSCLIQKKGIPTLFIELMSSTKDFDRKKIDQVLSELGLKPIPIKIVSSMPLDKRHNSKINRSALHSQT